MEQRMRKSLNKAKQNLSLPRLSNPFPDTSGLDVRNEKHYVKPKLKRIRYPPLANPNKERNQIVMVESHIQKRNYEELQEEAKERTVLGYLRSEETHEEDKQKEKQKKESLIGRDAAINYYGQYKRLDKVLQKNQAQNQRSILKIIHSLTFCLATVTQSKFERLVKPRGESSVLNVNNYKMGDKYVQAMAAGLKQAKLIQSCLVSNNRLTSRGASEFLKSVSNDISTIDLSHNKIRNIDQKLLNLIIENECRLQRLSLENNMLGDNSIQSLCRSSAYSKHLKVLNIRKNMLTIQSAEPIAQLINKSQVLEELYIGMVRLHKTQNRICNVDALKILEALPNSQTLKVFDYSLNKLGQGKCGIAQAVAASLRKSRTMLHVDFSSNYFSKDQSAIIAEGLIGNKKIYGIHFRGNYGFIDSKGFLILKEKQDTTLHSILDLQINSYQVNFRRQQRGFEPQQFKNVCWICEGWQEQEFKFVVPAQCDQDKKLVYIHFDFELFEPRLINLTERNIKYRTMVPPKKYRYFFTCNRKQYLDQITPQTSSYDLALSYTYQMYHEQYEFHVQKVSYRTGKAKKIVNDWDELQVTVLPRVMGLVTKREKIPWSYKDSSWAKEWKLEDDDLIKRCFERDWKCSKISNLIKVPAEQEKVKEVLYRNYRMIKDIYRNYSSWSPFGDVWAVSNNTFTEFCHEAKIVSKETPLKIIDLTFITTNSMSGADWKGNQLVPQRGLVRFQFMQALVRLSEQKYRKLGLCDTVFESISSLLTCHIQPISTMFEALKWRLEKYFIEQNDTLLKRFRPIFSQVYKKNSKVKVRPGQKPFMCLSEFRSVMERAGVAGTTVLERDINLSFNCAMMTQVDEIQSQRFVKMTEIQFIEAVARVAYLLPNACKVEVQLPEPTEFYYKLEWLINQIKNNVCSDDMKTQFPSGQKSIFSEAEEDE